ncbi:MFS transporter [Vibrio sp. PP-XX7]
MNALAPSILIFSTLLVQLSSGINYVTIPVVMTEQGYGHSLIGSAMAFEILGMLLLFKPLSSLVAQLGLRTCMGLLTLMRAVSLMLMGHSESYPLWLFCIGLYGLATGMTLVMSQTWLNLLAQAKSRGVLMGLFSSALSCGVALGPLVLQLPWLNDGETFELNTWMTGLPCVLLLLCPRQGNTQDNIGKDTI